LQLEDQLAGLAHGRPRWRERRQPIGGLHDEQPVEAYLGHVQLRRSLPLSGAMRNALGLPGEGLLGELIELAHGAQNRPRGRGPDPKSTRGRPDRTSPEDDQVPRRRDLFGVENTPSSISADRTATASGWFRMRTAMVARATAVRPMSNGPSH